jgi:hypothetical protein
MNGLNLLTLSSVLLGPPGQADTTPTAAATAPATTVTTTLTSVVEPTTTPLVVTPPTVVPAATGGTAQAAPLDYLTQAAVPALGPFSIGFLLLSLIVLGAGLYFFFVGKNRWQRVHSLNYRTANTWSIYAMVLGGLGLLFVLFRVIELGGLNIRLWLYLLLLVMLGFAAYGAYYFFVQYPKLAAAFNKRQGGRAVKATARARTSTGTTGDAPTTPAVPKGNPGNPRGTSPRGERRRTKR